MQYQNCENICVSYLNSANISKQYFFNDYF